MKVLLWMWKCECENVKIAMMNHYIEEQESLMYCLMVSLQLFQWGRYWWSKDQITIHTHPRCKHLGISGCDVLLNPIICSLYRNCSSNIAAIFIGPMKPNWWIFMGSYPSRRWARFLWYNMPNICGQYLIKIFGSIIFDIALNILACTYHLLSEFVCSFIW